MHWGGRYSITFFNCEEPGRIPQCRTVLCLQHHYRGPILHPQDPVFPHKGRNTTPGPSIGHLFPVLLQFTLGWTPSLCLNCCSISRMLQCALFSINPNSPIWSPSSVTSTGLLLNHQIQDGGAGVQGCQWNCTCLPPKHFAQQHQLASWYHQHWEQTKLTQRSCDSSLFWHPSGETNSWPMLAQQNHSPSSAKDSRLGCSDFTSNPHSMTPFCSNHCPPKIKSKREKKMYGIILST